MKYTNAMRISWRYFAVLKHDWYCRVACALVSMFLAIICMKITHHDIFHYFKGFWTSLFLLFSEEIVNYAWWDTKSNWKLKDGIFDWVKPWVGVKNQLSNFAISFLYIIMIYIDKKVVCWKFMYVCLSVCLSVSCQFWVAL